MNGTELKLLWNSTLKSAMPSAEQFERLATAVVEVHSLGDKTFRKIIQNRLKRIGKRPSRDATQDVLDLPTAQLLIADEIGFNSWDELTKTVANPADQAYPLLFRYAVAAMERGDFSTFESMIGGSDSFDQQIAEWYEKGYFENHPETLAEVFTASCMLGHDKTASYLLDKGVDPLAGMKTGLNGFHYAASRGHLDIINLLIARNVSTEVENMYGGTVLGQALWSAVNEHAPGHAPVIEALMHARGEIDAGTIAWWETQAVPSEETKQRVRTALKAAGTGRGGDGAEPTK